MAFGRRGRPGLLATAARTAVIAGTAQAVTGKVATRQAEAAAERQATVPAPAAPSQPAAVPAPAPVGGDDLVAQLERLGQLHAGGILTPEEFSAAKSRLLG